VRSSARITFSLGVQHAHLVITTLGQGFYMEVARPGHIAVVLAISSVALGAGAFVLSRDSVSAHRASVARILFGAACAGSKALATRTLVVAQIAFAFAMARLGYHAITGTGVAATIIDPARISGAAFFTVTTETSLASAGTFPRGTGTTLGIRRAVAIVNLADIKHIAEEFGDVACGSLGVLKIRSHFCFVGHVTGCALAVARLRLTLKHTNSCLLTSTIGHLARVEWFTVAAVADVLNLAIEREGIRARITVANRETRSRFGADATF
jgi:hypothetical protein